MESTFAPTLGRAVMAQLEQGRKLGDIEHISLSEAASLRGIRSLINLNTLNIENPVSLAHLRGHPSLENLTVSSRGRREATLDVQVLAHLPELRDLMLMNLRIGRLPALCRSSLQKMELNCCSVKPQRLTLPPSLRAFELDSSGGMTPVGVCPQLSVVDLWGCDELAPMHWLGEQPAIEELWLVGCQVPTLTPLLNLSRPPRWIIMGEDTNMANHRATITELEQRGSCFAIGEAHEMGVWLPGRYAKQPCEVQPVYLSPRWPHEDSPVQISPESEQ